METRIIKKYSIHSLIVTPVLLGSVNNTSNNNYNHRFSIKNPTVMHNAPLSIVHFS
ncbi:MAG: hypothetical protein JNL70_24455 [Saprospiraceae bacterium]|nr:hypothetical protein [Saprospiraceae bacterium]